MPEKLKNDRKQEPPEVPVYLQAVEMVKTLDALLELLDESEFSEASEEIRALKTEFEHCVFTNTSETRLHFSKLVEKLLAMYPFLVLIMTFFVPDEFKAIFILSTVATGVPLSLIKHTTLDSYERGAKAQRLLNESHSIIDGYRARIDLSLHTERESGEEDEPVTVGDLLRDQKGSQ